MTDWTHVQSASAAVTSATPAVTVTAVGSGHIIVGAVSMDPTIYLKSVTDNQGNLYDITAADNSAIAVAGFKSRGLITNAPTSIELTLSAAPSQYGSVVIDEFTPPSGTTAISLDGTTTFTYLQSGQTSSSVFPTRKNDVLIYGFGFSGAGSLSAGALFTLGVNTTVSPGAGTFPIYSEYLISASANASNAITWGTVPNDVWGVGFGIAPVAADSWVPVQSQFIPLGSATASATVTLPNKMKAGNIFVCGASVHAGLGTITSITDDLSNNYLSTMQSNVVEHCMFWSGGPLTDTPQSITITTSGDDLIAIDITEFAPPPGTTSVSMDQFVGSLGTSNATENPVYSAPALTTTKAHELIVSFCGNGGGQNCQPYNMNALSQNWINANSTAYVIQDSVGSFTAEWNGVVSSPCLALAISLASAQSGISTSPQIGGCRIGTIGAL